MWLLIPKRRVYLRSIKWKNTDLRADLTFTATLEKVEEKLRTKLLSDLPEYIRARNAFVAKSVEENAKTSGKVVTRARANKFYLDRGYVNRNGLRAGRGYFTSIRPGTVDTLLNINPATAAFLPPITVSDFIRSQKTGKSANLSYVAQLLQVASLQILYIRGTYEDSEIDYNSEAAPLKVFTQLRMPAKEQKFYKLLDAKKNEKRKADPADKGTFVYDYFTKSKLATDSVALSR